MCKRKILPMALAFMLPAAPVMAEENLESAGPLEEVVVSAFRRQAVLDLPQSLTVLDRQTIEAAAVQHLEELVRLVPNMNFSGDGSRARYLQLRGVGELEQYEGAPNPSIGFIIDDIDLSGVGGIASTFDLQRAEVLRGPQATRFGASALAGLVYLQSTDPGEAFDVLAEATVGNDDTLAAGFAVGGPMTDRVGGRLSVRTFRSNGFRDNVALGVDDSNRRDETTARAKLKWDIGESWSARLALLHVEFDNGYDAWSPENGRVTFSDNPGRDVQRTSGGSLKLQGRVSAGAEFVSLSGYASSDILFSFDGEWGDEAYWAPYGYDYVYSDRRDRSSLSQEFRLLSTPAGRLFGGRSDWVLGLYAQRLEERDAIRSSGLYDDSVDFPFSFCTPCIDDTALDSDYTARNLAVFGRLDTALVERWRLNAGLRLERWKADYADAFTDYIYGDPASPVENRFGPDEDLWGGDLGLEYDVSTQSRVYLLLSRGYKAGGFNPSLARALGANAELGPEAIVFDPEKLLNLELGLKGQWLDGRLTGEASLFWMDRRDMQLRSSAQFTDNPNDFVFITSNAGGKAWGLEAALQWQLTGRWRLHGSLGLLQSEIDAYGLEREADIPGELLGREFAHAPPYTYNLGASYEDGNGWFGRLDLQGVGSFYYDYSHDEKSGAYEVLNLRVGRRGARWSAYAWVRNLLDEDYTTRGFSFGLEPPFFPRSRYTRLADPRHYGMTVSFRY